jgi:hypothetical protein
VHFRRVVPRDPSPTLELVKGRYEVRLYLSHHFFRFPGSSLQLRTIFAYTPDKELAKYLQSNAGLLASWKAFMAAAQGMTCADVMRGEDFARLERAVGRAVQAEYRKVSKRNVAFPDVMLGLDGGYNPYCQPPAVRAGSQAGVKHLRGTTGGGRR